MLAAGENISCNCFGSLGRVLLHSIPKIVLAQICLEPDYVIADVVEISVSDIETTRATAGRRMSVTLRVKASNKTEAQK